MVDYKLKWLNTTRIDIKNKGMNNDVKIFVLKGIDFTVAKPQWFSGNGIGYTVESSDQNLMMNLQCRGAGELIIRLMGIDRSNKDGTRIPLFTDYTRLAINRDVIFWEVKPQWHDNTYTFTKNVDDGENVLVEISWSPHGYKGDELLNLLSLW